MGNRPPCAECRKSEKTRAAGEFCSGKNHNEFGQCLNTIAPQPNDFICGCASGKKRLRLGMDVADHVGEDLDEAM